MTDNVRMDQLMSWDTGLVDPYCFLTLQQEREEMARATLGICCHMVNSACELGNYADLLNPKLLALALLA